MSDPVIPPRPDPPRPNPPNPPKFKPVVPDPGKFKDDVEWVNEDTKRWLATMGGFAPTADGTLVGTVNDTTITLTPSQAAEVANAFSTAGAWLIRNTVQEIVVEP